MIVMLFAVSSFAEPTPKQRELIEQLLSIVDAQSALDERDREALKIADAQKAVREALMSVYASRFNESELAELVAFFQTPVGKKLARVTPELMTESLEKSRAALEPIIRREEERLMPWAATMTKMKTIANALEQFAVDNAEYPQTSFTGLKRMLVPNYLPELPEKDAWGNEFYYSTSRYGRHYRIVSAGADGVFELGTRDIPEDGDHFENPLFTNDLKLDLIYSTGAFMQLPRIAAEPE